MEPRKRLNQDTQVNRGKRFLITAHNANEVVLSVRINRVENAGLAVAVLVSEMHVSVFFHRKTFSAALFGNHKTKKKRLQPRKEKQQEEPL
jgi:S-adenosylmethionine/arginine decarboxylase-like enzyme